MNIIEYDSKAFPVAEWSTNKVSYYISKYSSLFK